MASVTGSRLAFNAAGFTSPNTNVVLTTDGTDAAGKAVAGKFNIEVFTTTAGKLAAGFQASAFVQGAQALVFPGDTFDVNFVQAGSPSSTEQMLAGSFQVVDFSGGSSPNESIQIVGDSVAGGADIVFGSSGDTITGSSFANVTQYIDVSGAAQNTSSGNPLQGFPAPGPETVIGGAGNTQVIAGSKSVITGGAGALQVNQGTNATVKGGVGNLTTFLTGQGFSITGSTGGTTSINEQYPGATAGNSSIVGGSGTGIIDAGFNTKILAATGDKITVGSATTLVEASKGSITVTGGDGTTTGGFGLPFNTVITAGKNDSISLGAAPTLVDGFLFAPSAVGTTVTGGGGLDFVFAGAGMSIVGGKGEMDILPFSGGDTVTGGAGNLFVFNTGKGVTATGSTGGWTIFNDAYGSGGNSSLVGGSSTVTGAFGTAFSSFILGAAGDTITGGAGATSVSAFLGNETVTGGAGAISVQGGPGDVINNGGGTLLAFLDSDFTETVNLSAGHKAAATLQDATSVKGATSVSGTGTVVGGGATTVTGFAVATDIIKSSGNNGLGISVDSKGNFLGSSKADAAGTGTVLTFVDGSTMTLLGVGAGSTAGIKFTQ